MAHRILLVDDEPDLLAALSLRLTSAGYQCATANNSFEALDQALADPPDLILTDLSMPGMDGYELCRRLKATPENEIAGEAQAVGVARLLYKLVESRELLSTVREVLTTMGGTTP